MPINFLHSIIQRVDRFSFEDICDKVIDELCNGERSTEYLQGISDTLLIIKDMYKK